MDTLYPAIEKAVIIAIKSLAYVEGQPVKVSANGESISVKFESGNAYWISIIKQCEVTTD